MSKKIKGNQVLNTEYKINKDKISKTDETVKESPVYNVLRIPVEKVRANEYNPNSVATPEMELLITSIRSDGFTMPIVCYYIEEEDMYEIVDGFHRYTVAKEDPIVREREEGTVPVSVINKSIDNRIASTIRHNKARGEHDIGVMSSIVGNLVESGLGDDWIKRNLGMDSEELLRLKQVSGIASLFEEKEFRKSWLID